MRDMEATDLERLIKQTYKVKDKQCDIVCGIMWDQKIITASAYPQSLEEDDSYGKEVLKKFLAGELKLSDNYPNNAQIMGPQVLEYIINDLCYKDEIEKGEFLLRFDD